MTDMSELSNEKLPFFLAKNTGLGVIRPEDELLHPQSFKGVDDDSATETQYFGFSIPEENIHALTYNWWHPNLKIVTGGLYVWQGVKQTTIEAELCDWRTFMSDKVITKNDLHEFRFDNGYGVKILEPNRRFHITYDNAANQNSVDVTAEAVLPGVMFADGNHFEQTMKMKGTLVLRGKKYNVDCYSVRDRSWGKPRPETLMPVPPMSWMVGTFNDDFSFNCTMFDHVSGQPERNGQMVMADDQALNGGWVHRDGKLGRIVKGSKRVMRGAGSYVTSGIDLQFSDEHGREFKMKATLNCACPLSAWNNVWMMVNLMRWECDGMVGYGDHQEAFWGNYANSSVFKTFK